MDAFRQGAQDGVDTARDALTKADKLSDAMKNVDVNTDPSSIETTRQQILRCRRCEGRPKNGRRAAAGNRDLPDPGPLH